MFKVVVTFLLVLACVTGAGAARDTEFDVGFSFGWDGYYRPMEWTPVEIGISSDLTEPFGGTLVISAPQDGLNRLNVARSFVLTPEAAQNLPLVTKFAFGMGRCSLEVRDQRGRVQWEQVVDMWDYNAQQRHFRAVQAGDLLIGVIGQPRFGLLRLPRDTVCISDRGEGRVFVGRKLPRVVPWDWTGFASLDALILYDPDWTLLRPEQTQAIAEWVSNGGRLLMVLGRHPLPQDNLLVRMLPFDTGQPRQVDISADVLTQWGLDADGGETVTAWPLFARPGVSLIESTRAGAGGYLHGLSYAGFGRVTVLAFDPAELDQKHLAHTAGFWTAQLAACLGEKPDARNRRSTRGSGRVEAASARGRAIAVAREDDEDERQRNRSDSRFRISVAQKASNRVMEYLYQLAEMRPLSIWWVILTLTALALILGPLDYLVLKRFDKLPYTWLTSTGWIVLFTVGAYYGVQALRGGRMQLRAVSVLDGIANTDCAWATHYAGLYSPRSADYQLEGLDPRQWWSGVAPSREEMWSHQQGSAMRQIYCIQEDGANLPVSVPINIWTVQSLLIESRLKSVPLVVSVERVEDRCVVEVTNASDVRVEGGCVLLADAHVEFGPVEARSTEQFDLRTRPFNPWQSTVSYHGSAGFRLVPQYPGRFSEVPSDAFLAQGCLERSLAMHAYLERGAALVCVEFEEAPAPFEVKDRTYAVNHIQLARLIVFPKDGS